MPFLSVVIPVYNREREIRRTLDSCVAQQDADFEVIVVDDASRDNSTGVVEEYCDRGVRLVRQPINRGSTAARAAGVNASKGEWIVRLDSDDELLPGALHIAQRSARAMPAGVGKIGLMYRYDDGRVSPYPPPAGKTLDYEGFLRWLDTSELYDSLTVLRRSALDAVPLPDARLWEMLHNLDFAKHFETVWLSDFGTLYHVDAADRQSKSLPPMEEILESLREVDLILERHGDALRRVAPGFYRAQLRRRVVAMALAGNRAGAMREGLRQLASYPLSPLHWAALGCVTLGRRPLKLALDLKWRLVEHRRMRFCKA